jgi:VanZ family protein
MPHELSGGARLRRRGVWHAFGAGFVALVVALSLAPTAPDAGRMAGINIGHVLAYAWLMFWYAQLFTGTRARVAVAVAVVGLGIALEYLQALTPTRHFAYGDMRDDALGVAAGWMFAAMTDRWTQAVRRL